MVSAGVAAIGVLVVSGGLVVVPPPGVVPVAVAVLSTTPAFTSACVIVCVPVQVVEAPGASVVTGHTAAASSWASLITRPVSVTLPVFVTRNVYAIVLPAVLPEGVPAVLSMVSAAVKVIGVVTVLVQREAAGQVGSPPPDTVAMLVASGSAASVGVIGMMKLVLPPAARPAGIVQVTVWPAAVQPAGSVPRVRPVGMVSVIVLTAVVAAVPVFDTCSV